MPKCLGFTSNGSKTFQLTPQKIKGKSKPKNIQNFNKRMDLEKYSIILALF